MKPRNIFLLFILILSSIGSNYSISQISLSPDSLKALFEKASDSEKTNILKQMGDNYKETGQYEKAIILYQQSLETLEVHDDTLLHALVSREIGVAYYYLSDFKKALEYYFEALKYYEQVNDQSGILVTLNRIGNAYLETNDNKEALKYYLKSYEICKQTDDKKGLYSVLNNIGILYLNENNNKALQYFREALLLMGENNDTVNTSAPILNMALVYSNMGEYDTALHYCFKALKLKEKFNDRFGTALATSDIAKLNLYKGCIDSTRLFLDNSLKISREIDAKAITKNNYYFYTLLHAMNGDLREMRRYIDLYLSISDSIFNEQSSRLIAEMQTKYETEKKEQQIDLLNIENELKETQLQARTYWLVIFIIAFVLILIYVIFRRKLLFAHRSLVLRNLEIVESGEKYPDSNVKIFPNGIDNSEISEQDDEKSAIKYQGSTLTAGQKQEIKQSIFQYMSNDKNYLKIDYTLDDLSNGLGINKKYVSQVINELYHQNFSNFINEYRIKEARRMMSMPGNFNYTIEAIAGLVGYRSKTAFNNAFKKYVGVTPSFYLKTLKDKTDFND